MKDLPSTLDLTVQGAAHCTVQWQDGNLVYHPDGWWVHMSPAVKVNPSDAQWDTFIQQWEIRPEAVYFSVCVEGQTGEHHLGAIMPLILTLAAGITLALSALQSARADEPKLAELPQIKLAYSDCQSVFLKFAPGRAVVEATDTKDGVDLYAFDATANWFKEDTSSKGKSVIEWEQKEPGIIRVEVVNRARFDPTTVTLKTNGERVDLKLKETDEMGIKRRENQYFQAKFKAGEIAFVEARVKGFGAVELVVYGPDHMSLGISSHAGRHHSISWIPKTDMTVKIHINNYQFVNLHKYRLRHNGEDFKGAEK